MSQVAIYGLYDPETTLLRYIGKANDPDHRFAGHLREMRRRRTPLYDWLRSLLKRGLLPTMGVIEWCEAERWQERERFWIAAGRHFKKPLLNLAEGGDEPGPAPLETRIRQARHMTATRPKNVMRLYRRLESAVREARRDGVSYLAKCEATLALFKEVVATMRRQGRLDELDSLVAERWP